MDVPHESFLETAHFIGARLCRDAIWAGKRCNWFGVPGSELRPGGSVAVQRMCGFDLFNGTTGIAAFLAHLYSATGEKIFRMTAEGAIRQALSRLDDLPAGHRAGFYTGLTGIAYVLFQLADTCGIDKFASLAHYILKEISNDDVDDKNLTVWSGTAGAISPLLKIHRTQPRDSLLDTAVRYGEYLLTVQNETEDGWYWHTNEAGSKQVGLAFGIGGIAWALLELYHVTNEDKFRHAAEEGFRYETNEVRWLKNGRRPVIPEKATEDSVQVSLTWAEGAAGMGLTRLRFYQLQNDETALRQTRTCLRRISESSAHSGFETERLDFSPAQGLSGHAEFLLEASRVLVDQSYRSSAQSIGEWGIDRYRNDNLLWPCGTHDGTETPALMNGLSGIGYFYLRLHDSMSVPSLLLVCA